MIRNLIPKNRFLRKIGYIINIPRAVTIVNQIGQYLDKNKEILDIGSGPCNVSKILTEKDYRVTPLDIKNWSLVENINPIIFDG